MPSSEVMHKWKAGTLRSGSKSGPPVKSQAQAVAIMLSEKRKEGQHGGKYPHKATGGGLGILPGTNVPPLPGGVGSMMPPQGLGAPMGMRAGGGEVDDDGPLSGNVPLPISRSPVLQMDPMAAGMLQRGAAPTQEIIPPSSPNVAAAIKRASAWMQERAQRDPQPILQRNIQMMLRGGPMAEAIAKHTLSTFQPHPSEALPAPTPLTIDAERRGGRIGLGYQGGGGAMDLPNPFLDMDYAPKPPSSAPPSSDALKFWQHPSPKVIPIRERADGGNVVPFGPRLIDANWEKFRLNPNYQQNRETNALLHRVLGMDSNVVPMSPGSDDKARGGGLGYQFGGSPTSMGLTPGWIERQEARNISHTGPIISAVGGRTDNHAINVPSGSYVLPAAHVSAMGQGNTLNGMQILTRMFGQPMKLPHGAGPPPMRAPRAMGMSSSGGSRGNSHIGRPVPIMAAGGEFVLSPDQVARVGGGDVNHGHAVLDRWVQNTHKKYAKTIANLPPPAKT